MKNIKLINPLETKRTLSLIVILLIVTLVLFAMSLNEKKEVTSLPTSKKIVVTPLATTLVLQSPLTPVSPATPQTLPVIMDTGTNNVTGVQLGLKYDPTVISSISIKPVGMLAGKKVLFSANDKKKGLFTFASVVSSTTDTIEGKGVVAEVTITIKPGNSQTSTQISFFPPETIVTARGANIGSVIKSTQGATIILSSQK